MVNLRLGSSRASVLDLVLFFLALVDAVQKEALNVGLLSVVDGLEGPELLVIFLFHLDLVLQQHNVEVARRIVGLEELHNSLLNLGLREILTEKIEYVLSDLVIGRVETDFFQFLLRLRQACEECLPVSSLREPCFVKVQVGGLFWKLILGDAFHLSNKIFAVGYVLNQVLNSLWVLNFFGFRLNVDLRA